MRFSILCLCLFVLATNVLANDYAGPYQVIDSASRATAPMLLSDPAAGANMTLADDATLVCVSHGD